MDQPGSIMSVRVEFYGIARQRAGVESIDVDASCLSEMIDRLSACLPRLAESCFDDQRLRPGYLANINGRNFTTDPNMPLSDGDCVMILSADAGG